MKLKPTDILIKSGIGDDIAVLLEQALAHHADTDRAASVTLKITVRTDPDSGKTKAVGRVTAALPDGDSDTLTKKLTSIGILTLANDHPGQQTIGDLTVEQVIARIKLAIAGSGKTAAAYSNANDLPYVALSKLLNSGMAGDTGAYGAIYDHAMTLNVDENEEADEQDRKSQAAG